jgi:putative ABC transport system substrate-binding protein
MPTLTADLLRRQVVVIAGVNTTAAALVAKAATTKTPIVFSIGADPVKFGLVASLNRPGGNVTGVSYLANALGPKRLGLLHELLPNAAAFAVLANPTNPNAEADISDLQVAAQSIGLTLNVGNATNEREIEAFFATLVQQRASAFLPLNDQLFVFIARKSWRWLHAMPFRDPLGASSPNGGLMGWTQHCRAFRQVGIYQGRILRVTNLRTFRHAADQVRVRDQPQDRTGPQPHCATGVLAIADAVIDSGDRILLSPGPLVRLENL